MILPPTVDAIMTELINVLLFASVRDAVGQSELAVSLPQPATVANLRSALHQRLGGTDIATESLLIAVNQEYASDATVIAPDAEVACFPPVSGG